MLARESVVQHSPLFVAAEVREIEGRDREVNTLLSLATAIEADWLRELFPEDLKSELHVQFDSTAKRGLINLIMEDLIDSLVKNLKKGNRVRLADCLAFVGMSRNRHIAIQA